MSEIVIRRHISIRVNLSATVCVLIILLGGSVPSLVCTVALVWGLVLVVVAMRLVVVPTLWRSIRPVVVMTASSSFHLFWINWIAILVKRLHLLVWVKWWATLGERGHLHIWVTRIELWRHLLLI